MTECGPPGGPRCFAELLIAARRIEVLEQCCQDILRATRRHLEASTSPRGRRILHLLAPGPAKNFSCDLRRLATRGTADGVYMLHQVTGEGPVDLVWQFTFLSNVSLVAGEPDNAFWFEQMAAKRD